MYVFGAIVSALFYLASIGCAGFGFFTLLGAEFQSSYTNSIRIDPTYAVAWFLGAIIVGIWGRYIEQATSDKQR
ncbi:MAG: hypothetical protein HZC41_20300 [Chloroflexi bacterium]|nr:hypothetical protein [Chloroflexota bacterium]